jgi:hypothetical protein
MNAGYLSASYGSAISASESRQASAEYKKGTNFPRDGRRRLSRRAQLTPWQAQRSLDIFSRNSFIGRAACSIPKWPHEHPCPVISDIAVLEPGAWQSLNIVSIVIENESAVVVRVVVRAKARGPIVCRPRRGRLGRMHLRLASLSLRRRCAAAFPPPSPPIQKSGLPSPPGSWLNVVEGPFSKLPLRPAHPCHIQNRNSRIRFMAATHFNAPSRPSQLDLQAR